MTESVADGQILISEIARISQDLYKILSLIWYLICFLQELITTTTGSFKAWNVPTSCHILIGLPWYNSYPRISVTSLKRPATSFTTFQLTATLSWFKLIFLRWTGEGRQVVHEECFLELVVSCLILFDNWVAGISSGVCFRQNSCFFTSSPVLGWFNLGVDDPV